MANMSYCRFENTFHDMLECIFNIDDIEDLSESEARYRKKLINLCRSIAVKFEDVNLDDQKVVTLDEWEEMGFPE
jgi:hypothetical protein